MENTLLKRCAVGGGVLLGVVLLWKSHSSAAKPTGPQTASATSRADKKKVGGESLCRVKKTSEQPENEAKVDSSMSVTPLTALSPIDGRYMKACSALRPYFSEFGLIKYRV